jgi:hypothetical protein
VHNGGSWDIIASAADVIDNSKYLTSKNPSTGLYYRLHILNVGVYRILETPTTIEPSIFLRDLRCIITPT